MKKILIAVLIIAGVYFLFDHADPLPLNHEAIGFGYNHMMHSLFGLILIIAAGLVLWKGRSKKNKEIVR